MNASLVISSIVLHSRNIVVKCTNIRNMLKFSNRMLSKFTIQPHQRQQGSGFLLNYILYLYLFKYNYIVHFFLNKCTNEVTIPNIGSLCDSPPSIGFPPCSCNRKSIASNRNLSQAILYLERNHPIEKPFVHLDPRPEQSLNSLSTNPPNSLSV